MTVDDPRLQLAGFAKLVGGDGVDFTVRSYSVTIGRKSKAPVDLALPGDNTSVSRQHAVVEFNFETRTWQLSVQGKHGAALNGAQLTPASPPADLHSQDQIQIADQCLYFLLPKGSAEERAKELQQQQAQQRQQQEQEQQEQAQQEQQQQQQQAALSAAPQEQQVHAAQQQHVTQQQPQQPQQLQQPVAPFAHAQDAGGYAAAPLAAPTVAPQPAWGAPAAAAAGLMAAQQLPEAGQQAVLQQLQLQQQQAQQPQQLLQQVQQQQVLAPTMGLGGLPGPQFAALPSLGLPHGAATLMAGFPMLPQQQQQSAGLYGDSQPGALPQHQLQQ